TGGDALGAGGDDAALAVADHLQRAAIGAAALDQIAEIDVEEVGEPHQPADRDVGFAALDQREKGAGDGGGLFELAERKSPLGAQGAQTCAQIAPIHRRRSSHRGLPQSSVFRRPPRQQLHQAGDGETDGGDRDQGEVESTPEAAPAWRASIPPTTVATSGAVSSPMPIPSTASAGTRRSGEPPVPIAPTVSASPVSAVARTIPPAARTWRPNRGASVSAPAEATRYPAARTRKNEAIPA